MNITTKFRRQGIELGHPINNRRKGFEPKEMKKRLRDRKKKAKQNKTEIIKSTYTILNSIKELRKYIK